MGLCHALGKQHNQVWSYYHPAENGLQMTGHFLRGGGKRSAGHLNWEQPEDHLRTQAARGKGGKPARGC